MQTPIAVTMLILPIGAGLSALLQLIDGSTVLTSITYGATGGAITLRTRLGRVSSRPVRAPGRDRRAHWMAFALFALATAGDPLVTTRIVLEATTVGGVYFVSRRSSS